MSDLTPEQLKEIREACTRPVVEAKAKEETKRQDHRPKYVGKVEAEIWAYCMEWKCSYCGDDDVRPLFRFIRGEDDRNICFWCCHDGRPLIFPGGS